MTPAPSASDPRWSSSLRPPLRLQPAATLPPEEDDDRAVAELLNAAFLGNVSRAKKLVTELKKVGKDVNEAVAAAAVGVMGTKRRGPLHLAAANGNVEMCRLLMKTCDVDATDSDGATPLILAIQGLGSITIIRLLIKNGANINKADNTGVAPLHIAAERGLHEVAELLLSREAVVDLVCENGGAPLHIAVENGHAKMVELLLQHKANYDARNPATALVIAARKGLLDCIKYLLQAGADANIRDEDGKLPVQIAAQQGWKECIEILLPVTTHLAEYATLSINGIIQYEKTVSSKPQVPTYLQDDIEMKEFVQGRCNGTFAKTFRLFCGTDVIGSKRMGLKILCQAYRYVIDMFRIHKKSWGGKFAACNLRVTGGRFRIDLVPLLHASAEHIWADLMGITDCMAAYFVLGLERPIYVRHLFDLCKKLYKGIARGMHEPGALDRYLIFIYNHPSFGFSIERGDLIRGIGMTLKCCSTDDICAIVSCFTKRLGPASKPAADWRNEVINVAVLKDVLFASVEQEIVSHTHFKEVPEDNFIFCRHALEHGAERTLIKTGGNKYQMFCPVCKQPLRSKDQRDLVLKAVSAPGSPFRWAVKDIQTNTSSDTSILQTQPMPCPEELDLLVGEVFDAFIADSICAILLEPMLDNNPFVQARLKVFARSICVELNGEGEEKDDDEGLFGSSSSVQDNGGL